MDTPEGVKVADVAWCSPAFMTRQGYTTPYPEAPEICIEVRSPSHSSEEMRMKIGLYLGQGAREVWMVFETGEVRFFGHEGERPRSEYPVDLGPEFRH